MFHKRQRIDSSDEEATDDVEVAVEETERDDMSDTSEEEKEFDDNQANNRKRSRPRLESSDQDEIEAVDDESDTSESDMVKDKAKKKPQQRQSKVKSFKHEWLQKSISGSKTSLWLKPHPTCSNKALCTVCPKSTRDGFSINEGWKAVMQHGTGVKHGEQLKQCQENPMWKKPGTEPVKITEGLQKMVELSKRQKGAEEELLVKQTKLAFSMMFHNASGLLVDCSNKMIPALFGKDCAAKAWDMGRTKLTYFGTHGLLPFFQGNMVDAMIKKPFSIDFDESTVNGDSLLDINVSYINTEGLVEKRMLTAVALKEGTTGREVADTVVQTLEKFGVDHLKTMSVATDGCSTMLGVAKGAVTLLRTQIETLTDFGGCSAHDLSNILKGGVNSLCPYLTSMFSAIHSSINSLSMHKKRDFEKMEEWVGLEIRKVPKFIDVRFRVIMRLCEWIESQNRALYVYFSEIKEAVLMGSKEASEAELVVMELYLGNYLEVSLNIAFLLEVGRPVMDMISYFESSKIRIQHKQNKLILLLHDYLAKFVKNAGVDNNNVDGKALLQVNFKDKSKQRSDKNIFLGKKVEVLLVKHGINRDSKVLTPWLLQVRKYYEESVERMVKYFKAPIGSRSLQAMTVLDPNSWATMELDSLQRNWKVLGLHFTNVMEWWEVADLMTEVAKIKIRGVKISKDTEVDELFKTLEQEVDDDGEIAYPLVVRLGQALATIYHSSSPAERDYSLMNSFLADKTRNATSLRLLLTKMHVKAEGLSLKRSCQKCKLLGKKLQKSDGKSSQESQHCHCNHWEPPESLLQGMRNGAPSRKYKKDMEKEDGEEARKQEEKQVRKEDDKKKEKEDIKLEVRKMEKNNYKRAEEEKRAKKEKEKQKNASNLFKEKEPSAAAKKRNAQKKRLENI